MKGVRVGQRVQLMDRVPWPERRGCTGVIVAPPKGRYPQPAYWEALVLLDEDPLGEPFGPPGYDVTFSCVVAQRDLRPAQKQHYAGSGDQSESPEQTPDKVDGTND